MEKTIYICYKNILNIPKRYVVGQKIQIIFYLDNSHRVIPSEDPIPVPYKI